MSHLLEPESLFHNLRVHGVLGEGAMGAAHLAAHPILCTARVIKTFKVHQDDMFREA